MEYNTSRSRMLMPEYGRNVQSMVEYLLTVEDRAKRLQQAEIIIELMGTLNPHLKQIEDYKHKLWDHLYQMTNFNLDVDSPYPCPLPEVVFAKPVVIPYPQKPVKYKHLGACVEQLITRAINETDDEKKHGLTQAIGYYMKLAYANWHKEPVHDDMIKNELLELTGGKLRYEPGGFKVYVDTSQNNNRNNNFRQRNNNNNNSRNFKGGNNPRNGNSNNYRDNGSGGGYGNNNNNNYNKNRKFKNKNKQQL